jgi:hypothetical protein
VLNCRSDEAVVIYVDVTTPGETCRACNVTATMYQTTSRTQHYREIRPVILPTCVFLFVFTSHSRGNKSRCGRFTVILFHFWLTFPRFCHSVFRSVSAMTHRRQPHGDSSGSDFWPYFESCSCHRQDPHPAVRIVTSLRPLIKYTNCLLSIFTRVRKSVCEKVTTLASWRLTVRMEQLDSHVWIFVKSYIWNFNKNFVDTMRQK